MFMYGKGNYLDWRIIGSLDEPSWAGSAMLSPISFLQHLVKTPYGALGRRGTVFGSGVGAVCSLHALPCEWWEGEAGECMQQSLP